MKNKLICLMFFVTSFMSVNIANACEEWKSEWASLVWNVKKYYDLHKEFKDGKIGKTKLLFDAESIVSDINKMKEYVQKTKSCEDANGKYESRKHNLLSSASKATSTMRAGEFLDLLKQQ